MKRRTRVLVASFVLLLMAAAVTAYAEEDHQAVAGKILKHYFAIREDLAADSLDGVAAEVKGILLQAEKLAKLQPDMSAERLREFHDIAAQIGKHAFKLSSQDIGEVREHFSSLSRTLVRYMTTFGQKDDEPYIFYCSMGKKSWLQEDEKTDNPDYGAIWLQEHRKTGNPYYGGKMLRCGRIISEVKE